MKLRIIKADDTRVEIGIMATREELDDVIRVLRDVAFGGRSFDMTEVAIARTVTDKLVMTTKLMDSQVIVADPWTGK